jgi:hypothetical protein
VRRPNRSTFLLAFAGLAVLAVVALVASGGGGSGATLVSDSAIAQAARATAKVPGATITIDMKISMSVLPKPIGAHLEGIADLRRSRASVAGSYSNFPKGVPGASSDGTIPMEMVMVPPDIYFKSPLLADEMPDGKSWQRDDAGTTSQQLGQTDPTQTLRNLRAIDARVERLGHEQVHGADTTHYRATVKLRKLAALARPSRREAVRAQAERVIQLTGRDSYPIEVWIDGKHLVRRTHFVAKFHIPGQSEPATTDITADMYDFGPKPKIKRPPADDVYEAPKGSGAGTP